MKLLVLVLLLFASSLCSFLFVYKVDKEDGLLLTLNFLRFSDALYLLSDFPKLIYLESTVSFI